MFPLTLSLAIAAIYLGGCGGFALALRFLRPDGQFGRDLGEGVDEISIVLVRSCNCFPPCAICNVRFVVGQSKEARGLYGLRMLIVMWAT